MHTRTQTYGILVGVIRALKKYWPDLVLQLAVFWLLVQTIKGCRVNPFDLGSGMCLHPVPHWQLILAIFLITVSVNVLLRRFFSKSL